MAHKNITTIEDLARMINEGFKTTATKEDIKDLRTEMNQKFEGVETRLDKIEPLLMRCGLLSHPMPGGSCHGQWNREVV
jgi:hypothetical protein